MRECFDNFALSPFFILLIIIQVNRLAEMRHSLDTLLVDSLRQLAVLHCEVSHFSSELGTRLSEALDAASQNVLESNGFTILQS